MNVRRGAFEHPGAELPEARDLCCTNIGPRQLDRPLPVFQRDGVAWAWIHLALPAGPPQSSALDATRLHVPHFEEAFA